jgi:hypothetical protein
VKIILYEIICPPVFIDAGYNTSAYFKHCRVGYTAIVFVHGFKGFGIPGNLVKFSIL